MRVAATLGQQPAGAFSPLAARIQAEVGEFLAAKAFLLSARERATTPDDRAYVDQLLERQTALEGELGEVLPPLQRGEYSIAGLTRAAGFAYRMDQHMRAVRSVKRRLRGVPEPISWMPMLLWVGAGGLGLTMAAMAFRRRR